MVLFFLEASLRVSMLQVEAYDLSCRSQSVNSQNSHEGRVQHLFIKRLR
jgi:hypothetical protein